MNTKACKKCGIETLEKDFPVYRSQGKLYSRLHCSDCEKMRQKLSARQRYSVIKNSRVVPERLFEKIAIGQRFGSLIVTGQCMPIPKGKNGWPVHFAPCLCDCGTECESSIYDLFNGHRKSCGCAQNKGGKPYIERIKIGDKFGRLTVVADPQKNKVVECTCDCGKRKSISIYSLLSGITTSCGCYSREVCISRFTKHGGAQKGKVEKLYSVWFGMLERCRNPKNKSFQWYGGKGVVVCDEWLTYPVFSGWAKTHGYKAGLTIERLDNDLPYHPENCRWATMQEQHENMTSNVQIEAWGETKIIAQWARDPRCHVSYATLQARLQKHFWEPERAISQYPFRTF